MLVLASASPRRSELLRAAGIHEFTVRAADIDESLVPGESPTDYVARLSKEKSRAVARPDEIVLGADTTVVIHGEIAGKPIDLEDARRMLRLLSGQWHQVLTGVSVTRDDQTRTEVVSTRVKFATMSPEEIEWYISTGEPMDKAGAYGIQGCASRFIEIVDGNYSNVVGLPIQTVYQMLRDYAALD